MHFRNPILLLAAAAAAAAAPGAAVSIQFDAGEVRASGPGIPATPPAKGWASVLAVYAGAGNIPPMAGSYAVRNGTLIFSPAYPWAAGVHYRAVFQPVTGGRPFETSFDGPRKPRDRVAKVERVYPSGDVWPSNQLRLYIYFSEPMSRGDAAHYIHVLDSEGHELRGAHAVFLPGEELWDREFRRLTMTFDPGRIKRGLTSNENIGPPLTEGRHYTLTIDPAWPDARGVPMATGFRKSITGGPALRTPPDPKQWRVSPPKSGTSEALAVDFPAPMNYPLLMRMLTVSGPGRAVAGTPAASHAETEWRFTPRGPWIPGAYKLIADTGLEDVAGNHIGQPFDIDVFDHVTEHITTKTVSVPFVVR